MLDWHPRKGPTRATNENMNATATATATAAPISNFARTPDEIATRLDSWVASQQICWAILPTPSGVCSEVCGKLNTRPGGHEAYILHSGDVSTVTFPLSAVESVGNACIFLKY